MRNMQHVRHGHMQQVQNNAALVLAVLQLVQGSGVQPAEHICCMQALGDCRLYVHICKLSTYEIATVTLMAAFPLIFLGQYLFYLRRAYKQMQTRPWQASLAASPAVQQWACLKLTKC